MLQNKPKNYSMFCYPCVRTNAIRRGRKPDMLDDPDGYINASITVLILVSMVLAFLVP